MAGNKLQHFDSTGDSDYDTLHSGGRSLNVTDDPNSEVNNADGNQELQDQSSNELSASNLSTPAASSASANLREETRVTSRSREEALKQQPDNLSPAESILPRPAPRQSSPIKPQDSSPNSPAKNYDTTGSEGAVGYSSTPSNSSNAPQQTGNERYKDLDYRRTTFLQIEAIGQPDAAKLSQAGFYYDESIHGLRCCCCGGVVSFDSNYSNHEPWILHARLFPHCNLLLTVKGNKFVSTVQKKMTEDSNEYINTNQCVEPSTVLIQQYFEETQRVAEESSSGKKAQVADPTGGDSNADPTGGDSNADPTGGDSNAAASYQMSPSVADGSINEGKTTLACDNASSYSPQSYSPPAGESTPEKIVDKMTQTSPTIPLDPLQVDICSSNASVSPEVPGSGKRVSEYSPGLVSSGLSFDGSLDFGDLNSPDEVEGTTYVAEKENSESSLTLRRSSNSSLAKTKDDNKTEPSEEPAEQPEPLDERSVSEPSEKLKREKLECKVEDLEEKLKELADRFAQFAKGAGKTDNEVDVLKKRVNSNREDNLQSWEELQQQLDVSADEHQSTHEETERKLSSLKDSHWETKDNCRALCLKTNQLENKQERTCQRICGIEATQNDYQRELDSLKDETADQGAASQKGISNLRQDIRDWIGIPGASEIPHEEGSSAEEDSSAEDVEPEEEGGEDG